MRKLATVRPIRQIDPIPNADKIECVWIDGWSVVDQKGAHKVGDEVIFLEIDSWVPDELAPFLSKGKVPREYMGVVGERLKTVRLRGQLSQGLVLPMSVLEGKEWTDETLDSVLNINKWEAPEVSSGLAKGNWPSRIAKTDQERIQNLHREVFYEHFDATWEITTKLDGSSMTIYHIDGEVGVCSRKINLRLDQEGNHFVNMARKLNVLDKIKEYGKNIAIQGEIIGTGIQGNKENIVGHDFFVFDIWDCDNMCFLNRAERVNIIAEFGLKSVPVIARSVTLPSLELNTLGAVLEFANGPSLNNSIREGVVFKRTDGKFSFKAISNDFLLKYGG